MSLKNYTFLDSDNVSALIPLLDARYSIGQASNIKFGLIKLYDGTGDNIDGTMTQQAISQRLSSIYRYKGSLEDYEDLPKNPQIGDVYNIANPNLANHIKAGDNLAWNGTGWDNLSGLMDLSNYLQKNGEYIKSVSFNEELKTITFLLPDDSTESIILPSGLGSENLEFQDLNLLLEVGVYPINNLSGISNLPIQELGSLLVFSDKIYTHQLYYTLSGNFFVRVYNHSLQVWTEWSNIKTKLKQIYAETNNLSNPNFNDISLAVCSIENITSASNYPIAKKGLLQNVIGNLYSFQIYTTIDGQVFNRCKTNNAWSSWKEISPTITIITSGNLNNFTEYKTYHITDINNIILNKPDSSQSAEFIVTSSEGYIYQKYINSSNTIYIRNKKITDTNFSAWKGIIDSNSINSYAPLNSPTFTGSAIYNISIDKSDNSKKLANTEFVKNNLADYAPLNSAGLTGTPTLSTELSKSDNSKKIANTEFVNNYVTDILKSYALLASPSLTGNPTAPTQEVSNSSTRIATTAYVKNNLSSYALLASPTFTGSPKAPTQEITDNSTNIATTKYVNDLISNILKNYATLDSPILTGNAILNISLAKTDNSKKLANTEFVKNNLADYMLSSSIQSTYAPLASPTFTGEPKSVTPLTTDNSTKIATTAYVNNLAKSELVTYAPLASPEFSGTPKSPDVTAGDSTAKIANTKFVSTAISNALTNYAPLNSPNLTGTPIVPDIIAGTSTGQIANTRFVMTAIANLINSAPEALNTLSELSNALNNDPDFANTVMTAIGEKLPIAGGEISGNLKVNGTLTANLSGNATSATKATNDSDNNQINTTYATKEELTAGLDNKLDSIKNGEFNKFISVPSTGNYVIIGEFACYDSMIAVDINITSSVNYHCTAVLATQNVKSGSTTSGTRDWSTYGDSSNYITPKLYLEQTNKGTIRIYYKADPYAKVNVKILYYPVRATPTEIVTLGDSSSIPSTATMQPVNTLITNFSNREAITGLSVSGTTITYTRSNGNTGTITTQDNNTHYTSKLIAGISTSTGNATSTNGNTYLRLFDDSTNRSSINIKGTGATSVTSDANGVITINSTNTTYNTGNTSTAGITKLYTETGTNTDGTMTQSAIKSALDGKMSSSTAVNNVTQTVSTNNATYPLLAVATANQTATANSGAIFATGIKLNPSTGNISATSFTGNLTGNVTGNVSGSSGSCTGNAASATKATNDSDNNAINTTYAKLSGATFTGGISGTTGTFSGTLTLSKTTDLSGTANNSPALIVGGAVTSTHMEIDKDEIQAKTNGTSVAPLYLNNDGGTVNIGEGGLTVNGNITASSKTITAGTFKGNLTGNVTGNVSGSSGSCTGNAATATKATGDKNGADITTTYETKANAVTGLSVSENILTYTKGSGSTGTVTIDKANALTTARALQVSLSSAGAPTFNGTADVKNIGVTGVLPIANGGTGTSSGLPITNVIATGATSGNIDAITAFRVGSTASNKTFNIPASAIKVEYSRDSGATWTDYGLTDTEKKNLFSETRVTNVYLGKASTKADNNVKNMLRITINPNDRYVSVNMFYLWGSTNGNTWFAKLEVQTWTNHDTTTWTTLFENKQMGGWSGNNVVYFNQVQGFNRSDSQGGNMYALRFTFHQTAINANYASASFNDIRCYGLNWWLANNDIVKSNRLYHWDSDLNVTFPANITATSFIGSLTGNASSASKLNPGKTIQTNLASTTSSTFTGETNITPGVTGILGIANGGTGNKNGTVAQLTNARNLTTDLTSTTAGSFDGTANVSIGISGTLPEGHGGTGATSLANITVGKATYDTNGKKISEHTVEYIEGTQTAATGAWTGVTKDSALYEGKMIIYKLPYAGSGNATLNLTLSGGGTTGAKAVYRFASTRLTTQYGANYYIPLIYNGTYWFAFADYDSTVYDRIRSANAIAVAEGAIAASKFIGTLDGTNYKEIDSGITFDIRYPILYNITAVADNANMSTGIYWVSQSQNMQTIIGDTTRTFTDKSQIFIKGTLSGNIFTVHSDILTTTVPTNDDGYYYLYVGRTYSTYQMNVNVLYNQLWKYSNGIFQPIDRYALMALQDSRGQQIDSTYIKGLSLSGTTLTVTKGNSTTSTISLPRNYYGICSTGANTVAKTVSITGFTLSTGAKATIKFSVTNTAKNPTLNITSTGAKAIYYRGYPIPAEVLQANSTYDLVYNGTEYEIIGSIIWTE